MSLSEAAHASTGASSSSPQFNGTQTQADPREGQTGSSQAQGHLPAISQPKGGGAIRGIDEKFSVGGPTGTATLSIPISTSPGRSGFGPELTLSYNSGSGNGHFGFGWGLSFPQITRKTDKGLPRYQDEARSDVFILSGVDDLVPVLRHRAGDEWSSSKSQFRTVGNETFEISEYRPRIEGLFARIEKWTNTHTKLTHWRSISKDNVTSLYGDSPESRIFDPAEPRHIFTWLLSQTFDDKGNVIKYHYKAENSDGVDLAQAHEQYRPEMNRTVARYPKSIKYGNNQPRHSEKSLGELKWMFEVIFDYGDHDKNCPTTSESRPWRVRPDAFSGYRAGFEIRTYRRCERVLMFHHFPEEGLGCDYLVSSLDLEYQTDESFELASPRVASLIGSVTRRGYVRQEAGSYARQSLPPLEFEYSKAEMSREVLDLQHGDLENLPVGVDEKNYQWMDLDAEGLPGVLTQNTRAYLYKPNLGNGKLAPTEELPRIPSFTQGIKGHLQWLDLAGDGRLDLTQFDNSCPGFYKRDWDVPGKWDIYKTFRSLPNIQWENQNLRFVDVTGDGLADILILDDEIITFYPSWGEAGYGSPEYQRPTPNEDSGPRILFSNAMETVHLADMSGDGLSDLVRVRNGEICYWPNLGYGRFGPKVAMDNSPWLDVVDIFRQTRIFMADVDGSGTTDIIYIHDNLPLVFLNQAGNCWSEAYPVHSFPRFTDVSNVSVVDLLGRGTSCLVWSSNLPGDSGRQIRYVDLMSNGKPYLLTVSRNNLGSERHVEYSSSTQFYLEDKATGRPWVTRLPFPVQVVSRVTSIDRISGNRFIQKYSYHEGFFDPFEREFRGFGMVETRDSEDFGVLLDLHMQEAPPNFNPAFYAPPVLSKRWYDTGAYLRGVPIARECENQYYREPGAPHSSERSLSWTTAPRNIRVGDEYISYDPSQEEIREAYRSLKGLLLREEIYGLDGSKDESQPYQVMQSNMTIDFLQPRGPNQHSIFFPHPREALKYKYERNSDLGRKPKPDPCVSHKLNLLTDAFGNSLWSLSINYGRRYGDSSSILNEMDRATQRRALVTLGVHLYTNKIIEADTYRTPVLYDSKEFELRNFSFQSDFSLVRFSQAFTTCQALQKGGHDIPFEDSEGALSAEPGKLCRRLLSRTKVKFRQNNLLGPLPFGKIESLAIVFESYSQVFTPGLLQDIYVNSGKIPSAYLHNTLHEVGRYIQLPGDPNYWNPSGRIFYSPGKHDSYSQEASFASQHFYQPMRFRDPFYSPSFDTEISIGYDKYDMLIAESRDAMGNIITVGTRDQHGNLPKPAYDYRVLKPTLIMDYNRNQTAFAYDILGTLTATAVMGKPEERVGDILAGFNPFLSEEEKTSYLKHPLENGASILGQATSRMVYDELAFYRTRSLAKPHPPVTSIVIRETHVLDLPTGEESKLQHVFLYADGGSHAIQSKVQADGNPHTQWIASGWKIYNNKGDPVRTYEPIYTHTHEYQAEIIEGVCSTIFYDPLARVVATLFPNHTWAKSVITPWSEQTWDESDTILLNPLEDVDVQGYFQRLDSKDFLPGWCDSRINGELGLQEQIAAEKSSVFAATPSTHYFDPFSRIILAVSHNRSQLAKADEYLTVRNIFDINGDVLKIYDEMSRMVEIAKYDMLKNVIHKASMETSSTWSLLSVLGKPIFLWDSRDYETSIAYDQAERPTNVYLRDSEGNHSLISRTVYGEMAPEPERFNLRGRKLSLQGQSGVSHTHSFDFKGNTLHSSRQVPRAFKLIDWSTSVVLEDDQYSFKTSYDALNRVIERIVPDGSRVRQQFNVTNQIRRIELCQGADWIPVLAAAEYNAKGQRIFETYGNGVEKKYSYDPLTFCLHRILTRKNRSSRRRQSSELDKSESSGKTREASKCCLQDLSYIYDPVRNITYTHDGAQQSVFFRNQVVEPSSSYTYDALYRLIEATGREHLGQDGSAKPYGQRDIQEITLDHANDRTAMGRYSESYQYDIAGNISKLCHQSSDPSHGSWTRYYHYREQSQLEKGKTNNRLSSTRVGNKEDIYQYDGGEGLMGNITSMTGISMMRWDFRNQLQATAAQRTEGTPETTWYTYADGGQRVRKITQNYAPRGSDPTPMKDRLYLGTDYEIYREYGSDGKVRRKRHTLHISNGGEKILLIETAKGDCIESTIYRYQLGNYLGSSLIELDEGARIITHEEYYPYGSTSYKASRSQTEAPPKRYRYSAKEHDQETGLYYYGARYYAPWLGRWISADPGGLEDGPNLYQFVKSNPITYHDNDGRDANFPPVARMPNEVGPEYDLGAADDQNLADDQDSAPHIRIGLPGPIGAAIDVFLAIMTYERPSVNEDAYIDEDRARLAKQDIPPKTDHEEEHREYARASEAKKAKTLEDMKNDKGIKKYRVRIQAQNGAPGGKKNRGDSGFFLIPGTLHVLGQWSEGFSEHELEISISLTSDRPITYQEGLYALDMLYQLLPESKKRGEIGRAWAAAFRKARNAIITAGMTGGLPPPRVNIMVQVKGNSRGDRIDLESRSGINFVKPNVLNPSLPTK